MLRFLACLLTGTACLLGAVVSSHRDGGKQSGMVVEEITPDRHRDRPSPAPLPPRALAAKASARIRGESQVGSQGRVAVGGQVKSPGTFPFTPGDTLGSLVRKAGGATEFGSLRRASVIRGGISTQHDLTTPAGLNTPVQVDDVVEIPARVIWAS